MKAKLNMKKIYVVDANVFLQSPYAMFAFEDNYVYISESTIDKLYEKSTQLNNSGRNANEACRAFEELRKLGNIFAGIHLPSGGMIKITNSFCDEDFPKQWDKNAYETNLLATANFLRKYNSSFSDSKKHKNQIENKVIIVTKSISTRIKADTIGICSEDYLNEQVVNIKNQFTGRKRITVPVGVVDKFYQKKSISLDCIHELNSLPVNTFVTLVDETSDKHTALGVFTGNEVKILQYSEEHPYRVKPRNVGQLFAQEALLAPAEEIPLVILKGPAGTAKTFYSLAAGLHFVTSKESPYKKILLTRPNVKFDEDIGYLKGDEKEKIAPLLRPFIDNLEVLLDNKNGEYKASDETITEKINNLFASGLIDAQALAYLRGRSIKDRWIIVDEAQNLTPAQALGILTRAGDGSKIILCGDPAQIDNPYLDERTNGLSFASEKMKGSRLCRQVQFTQSECTRSKLAAEASQRLTPSYKNADCLFDFSKYRADEN